MAFIKVIGQDESEGTLRELYDAIASKRGKISNILSVHSLLPKSMETHLAFYDALMFGRPGISRRKRELIGTVVSHANGCEYCTQHHAEALMAYLKDRFWVQSIVEDPRRADLDSDERAMVEYVLKLTQTPADMDGQDIELLRAAGFADEDILSINLVASYFNFVNRVAMGLGVEFTEDEIKGYNY